MAREHIHFVTGRLAEHALRREVSALARDLGFDYSIDVLPITVAALMTPPWIAARIRVPTGATRVVLPGYCAGDLAPLENVTSVAVELGPRDLRRLPEYFRCARQAPAGYGKYDIEIIAEINHCPRRSLSEILSIARQLSADGADVIDIGCEPQGPWPGVSEVIGALRNEGFRVSIDSLDPREIEPAVRAGAELVLSVNGSNRVAARDWGCEVVAVPDDPRTLEGLEETIADLASNGIALRIDPVLEPIGFGFADSLKRYLQIRERYPDAEMMMGIGNITELTDSDSGAINTVLLGFCQEAGIHSVLTTQVINWAQTSVRECDLARRLVYHAVQNHELPKHVEPRLVLLRDDAPTEFTESDLVELAAQIKDTNYRIFVAEGEIHLVSRALHLHSADPFELFAALKRSGPEGGTPKNLDESHAFYLGYEMCKAATAITLSKQYQQDEALRWGFLSRQEARRHERRPSKPRNGP